MRAAGAICQRPCSRPPSSAAKQAAESKRGKHNQSIDPSRPTSAAVWQSPISAYCSMGRGIERSDQRLPDREQECRQATRTPIGRRWIRGREFCPARILPRKGASGPHLAPMPLDRLVRVGRIVRIVLEPARVRYSGLLALLEGLLFVCVGMLDRVTGSVLARRDDGFTHGACSSKCRGLQVSMLVSVVTSLR